MKYLAAALGVGIALLGILWFSSQPAQRGAPGGKNPSLDPSTPKEQGIAGPTSLRKPGSAFPKTGQAALAAWEASAGESAPESEPWPGRFKKSLASVKSDKERLELLEGEVHKCLLRDDFESARASLEITGPMLETSEAREKLAGFRQEIEKREGEDKVRVARELKEVEEVRVRAQLEFMKECLEKAKREKKPPKDIQSLEAIVRKLEGEVGEEK